jgi:uncharacterized protein YbcI
LAGATERNETAVTETQTGFAPTGEMLAGISTAIVGLYREHFGKGPTKAKTYALDDVVICVLRDGLTTVEKTLFDRGRADTVREVRSAFQDAVAERFTSAVESLTGRRVVAFMSQAHVDPDLAIEVFFLDRSLSENGSVETDGDGHPAAD